LYDWPKKKIQAQNNYPSCSVAAAASLAVVAASLAARLHVTVCATVTIGSVAPFLNNRKLYIMGVYKYLKFGLFIFGA
jgi:hypothetical protein